jgi:epoxyqueuosine reductase
MSHRPEALQMSLKASGYATKVDLSNVRVISWILPATQKTRLSNRKKTDICSLEWNHSRFQGQEFIFRLSRYVVVLLENFGYTAIVPELAPLREMVNLPNGLSSRWSERHAAYAAGLGTFSLSDGFITPKGISIRISSVVCNLAIPPSPKPYANHLSNCLFYSEGTCGKCIQRCPAGALSEKGHDKITCAKILTAMRESVSEKPDSDGYIGSGYLGCGLCQTKVPCEDRIPVTKTKNSK